MRIPAQPNKCAQLMGVQVKESQAKPLTFETGYTSSSGTGRFAPWSWVWGSSRLGDNQCLCSGGSGNGGEDSLSRWPEG